MCVLTTVLIDLCVSDSLSIIHLIDETFFFPLFHRVIWTLWHIWNIFFPSLHLTTNQIISFDVCNANNRKIINEKRQSEKKEDNHKISREWKWILIRLKQRITKALLYERWKLKPANHRQSIINPCAAQNYSWTELKWGWGRGWRPWWWCAGEKWWTEKMPLV